jgi:DNA ligase-1
MEHFAELLQYLEDAKSGEDKLLHVREFFRATSGVEAAWALKLLTGKQTKRFVGSRILKQAAYQASGLPDWLFQECLKATSDLAEAASLVVTPSKPVSRLHPKLSEVIRERANPLPAHDPMQQVRLLIDSWSDLSAKGRYFFNRLVLGSLRPAITLEEFVRAYSHYRGLPEWVFHLRLEGDWKPSQAFYTQFCSSILADVEAQRPYRLSRCSSLVSMPPNEGWHVEWKWHGVRVQAIRRGGESSIWLKSHLLVTDLFPEIRKDIDNLPNGTVLDGVIVGWTSGKPGPTTAVQSRLERKAGSKLSPLGVTFLLIAFDVLEFQGEDVRAKPLFERRDLLGRLRSALVPTWFAGKDHSSFSCLTDTILMPEEKSIPDISDLIDRASDYGASGIVLKRRDSGYPMSEDEDSWHVLTPTSKELSGVVMYVERGASGQIQLITIGVWKGDELVPIAKVDAELANEELLHLEAFVKENTLERFGPVRTIRPEIVLEVAYRGIEPAARRKAKIALQSARAIRLRTDLSPNDAARLEALVDPVP